MPGLTSMGDIDASVLAPVVRRVMGDESFEVTTWRGERVYESRATTTAAVYRFSGSGSERRSPSAWAIFLKVIQPDGGSDDPADYRYWRREPLILASGLLERPSTGLRAPRCYGIEERAGTIWLWLEDVPDTVARPWPLERYALAARHLGTFNGVYLSEPALPGYAWLTRNLLRDYLDGYEPGFALLASAADHPLVRRGWPGDAVARVRRLWEHQEVLLTAVARVPRTLCHGDPSDQNLLAQGEQTTAVDWAFAGIGAIGEDLAVLSRSFLPPGVSREAMDAAIFPAYVAGLREAGWRGDVRAVRLGYTAAAALRYALNPFPIDVLHDAERRARIERSVDSSFEQILDWYAVIRTFALDLAVEALALIAAGL